MKKLLLSILILIPLKVFAGPIVPVGSNSILNQSSLQNGAVFNVSSGTVQALNVSTITFRDGTKMNTAATTQGGGSSSMTVKLNGTVLSSSATVINFSPKFIGTQSPGGTANIDFNLAFSSLTDVDSTGRALGYTMFFNGSKIVFAAPGTNFNFGISSFTDGLPSTIEIGNGTWKGTGTLSFSAAYTNGPATSAYVSFGGWSNLNMTNSFQGPTATTAPTQYPASPGSLTFTLSASNGSQNATSTITHNFYNDRFWGISSINTGLNQSNVQALGNSDLVNSKATAFTLSPGAAQYMCYSYPARLGTATFTINGFTGGFTSPQSLTITNPSGYAETYYVYCSVNANLGTTTVNVN